MKPARIWRLLRDTGALMVGVPDYERYLSHMREAHPGTPPLSRDAFVRARMEARYGGRASGKCPC